MTEQQKITNWVVVCRSGRTIDGRTISEKMLTDAAQVYNPKIYTAMMWPYHVPDINWRANSTNYGQVVALKTETRAGQTCLLAKLAPNKIAQTLNGLRQKIFSSCEFIKNYSGTGKYGLTGLALTDIPASFCTEELFFSQRPAGVIRGLSEPVSFNYLTGDYPVNYLQYQAVQNQINNLSLALNNINAQLFPSQASAVSQYAVQPAGTAPVAGGFAPHQHSAQPAGVAAVAGGFVPGQYAAQPASAAPVAGGFAPDQYAAQPAGAAPQAGGFAPGQYDTQPAGAEAGGFAPPQYSLQPQALHTQPDQLIFSQLNTISQGISALNSRISQLAQDATARPGAAPGAPAYHSQLV